MVDVSLSQLHLQRRMAQLQGVMAKVSQLAEDKSDMEKVIFLASTF